MMKYIMLILLALLTMTGAVLEGLIEGLPVQFIQIDGLLTLVCAGVIVLWTLKLQLGGRAGD